MCRVFVNEHPHEASNKKKTQQQQPWNTPKMRCEHAFATNRLFKCHLMNISRMIVQYRCKAVEDWWVCVCFVARRNYKLILNLYVIYIRFGVLVHIFYELHSIYKISSRRVLNHRFLVHSVCGSRSRRKNSCTTKKVVIMIYTDKIRINNKCKSILPWHTK